LYNLDHDGISQFTYPAENELTPNILNSATKKKVTPTKINDDINRGIPQAHITSQNYYG
jgi:hypothetical protein